MREFDGRVAVVTGAASGMGRAFAERFALAGMKVVLADYEEKALAATVQEFRQREFEVTGVVADVASAEAVDDLANRAFDTYGKVHILCNNAGVLAESDMGAFRAGGGRPLWDQPLADWHWTFNVNVWGVVHGIRSFVPRMIAQDEPGHVVNTASLAGIISGGGLPIYGATKHAVVRISEALFHQLGEAGAKVGASVLCPGVVRTRIGFAERNRPAELAVEGGITAEDLAAREAAWSEMTSESMVPETVAEMVFNAIRDEQFYIITHDEYDPMIRARMEAILARANPQRPGA